MMEHPTPQAGEFTVVFFCQETGQPQKGKSWPVDRFWRFYKDSGFSDNFEWFAFNMGRQIVAYNDGEGKVSVPVRFFCELNIDW